MSASCFRGGAPGDMQPPCAEWRPSLSDNLAMGAGRTGAKADEGDVPKGRARASSATALSLSPAPGCASEASTLPAKCGEGATARCAQPAAKE